MPTINQDNGIPGEEPTEALQALRSDEVLRPSHKNKRRVIVIKLSRIYPRETWDYEKLRVV